MVKGFEELGERSDIDDVLSFAAIYKTIEGKTSDFGYDMDWEDSIFRLPLSEMKRRPIFTRPDARRRKEEE